MKGIQKITRLLLILLALAMMLSAFAACATEDDGDVTATDGDGDGDSTKPVNDGFQQGGPWDGWELDENGYIKDRLPEDMNFEDEFVILATSNQKSHFWADETDVTPVGQAIYKRNETVADRLGIVLEWNMQPTGSSSSAEKNAFVSLAEADIKSGNEIDCVVSYNLLPYRLAGKGLALNLKSTDNLDLEAPWWPQEFTSSMMYKDQLYALVDNASVGTLTNLSCIFFNNELLEAKHIQSPYELVKNNEWTVPKLKELIKDTYEDFNADGQEDKGDIYGLCTSTAARVTCWYYGVGLRFSNINENGELILNTDVETTTAKIDALVDMFSTKDSCVTDTKQYIMFEEERVYFYLCVVSMATHMVNNNVEIDYGVAPQPKLNSEQTRYYTHVPNTHEAWYLLSGTKNPDCSSAFIECMASEAYRQVNQVFFEETIKLRYAPGEELSDMYDLIRESITFDFVYLYGDVIGWDINTGIRNCIVTPTSYQWATVWAGIKDSMNTKFQTVLDVYEQNVAG